ncbi:MAG: ATP-binding protein [Thermoanaerobaculia bacterium]|nr:ATP-binding protein [Thermoanaerobaculia bacterium]
MTATRPITHERPVSRYEGVLSALADLVFWIDRQGTLVDCDAPEVTRLYAPPEAFLGRSVTEVLPPAVSSMILSALEEVFESSRVVEIQYPLEVRGQQRYFEARLTRCSDAEAVSVVRDITESWQNRIALEETNRTLEERVRERTEELTVLNEELTQSLRHRDLYMANMGHELRGPLNVMLGMAQSLRDQVYGPLNERVLRAVSVIENSGRHLVDLVSDILDLAKVQAGKISLSYEMAGIAGLCEASLRAVQKLTAKRKLAVSLEIDPEAGVALLDGRRLQQMLVNLLSNAAKFTPEGGSIGLRVTADPVGKLLRFTVWDSGLGISALRIPTLFEPFSQVDSSLARRESSSGLGLALVLNMAALHGGGVEVDSTPGKGSSFTITLPWVRVRPSGSIPVAGPHDTLHAVMPLPPPVPSPEAAPLTVLLAEDHEGSARTLSAYLSACGITSVIAHNGAEAVLACRRERPHLVLLDLQMPGLDGIKGIRRFRSVEATKDVPILAVTGLAMPGDRERCLAAGASGYVTKPLDLPSLVTAIREMSLQDDGKPA